MTEPTRRRLERKGSWLVVAIATVLVVVAAFWLLLPLRLF